LVLAVAVVVTPEVAQVVNQYFLLLHLQAVAVAVVHLVLVHLVVQVVVVRLVVVVVLERLVKVLQEVLLLVADLAAVAVRVL
jgi:hypothetical protein